MPTSPDSFRVLVADLATLPLTKLARLYAEGELDSAIQDGVLGQLASAIDAHGSYAPETSATALLNLLSVEGIARRFAAEVGLSRLVGWLGSSDARQAAVGVRAVSWVVWHEDDALRRAVVEAGAVPHLIARLPSEMEAVDALARLAASPQTLSALKEAGAFDALASLLARWVTDVTCLHALWPSLSHPEVRRGLVAAGWPGALGGLLRHDGACRVLARLVPAMSPPLRLRALYDLADWNASLRPAEPGVDEEVVRLCLPALSAEVEAELRSPGSDPARDPDRLLTAYRRYDIIWEFRRDHATALSRIRHARQAAALDGRYRGLLKAWAEHDALRADVVIVELTRSERGLARARDDFEAQPSLVAALVGVLQRVDAEGAAANWASTYALASLLATRRPVEDALWGMGTVEVFLRPWTLTTRDASAVGGVANPPKGDVRVGDAWIAPDAGIAEPEVLAVLVASLSVLARRWQRLPALGVSHLALTRAGRSPHAELARPAAQLARLLAWREDTAHDGP